MIPDRKQPGKVLWKTCELQGLGGVFHTSSNSRHSGKNVAEETSLGNVPGKMSLWKRLWKRHMKTTTETYQDASGKWLWQNVSGKTCLINVPETVHETRLRKTSLETLPKTTCPETSPKTPPENVTGNRVWGTSLKLYPHPSLKIVSGNVPGK